MYLEQYFIDGLGCASYLVGCESGGVAAVVDPDRDVQKYLDTAEAKGMTITHIIETHLHADHVSGNTDLADRTGADIYVHELAEAAFETKSLADGDTLKLGNVLLSSTILPATRRRALRCLSPTRHGPTSHGWP
ncbi:MAG: MBL fold metallo-hydrolase [Chloroflexota bacterium]